MIKAEIVQHLARRPFVPHPFFRNGHAQTIFGSLFARRTPLLKAGKQPRFFEVAPHTKILGDCTWQADKRACPTLVLVHGMEGSVNSGYMQGTAEQALRANFNVVRLNHRNCGATEHLTSTLYHAGLTDDVRAVIQELIEQDGLSEIYVAGFSLGGNVVLKLAGEMGKRAPEELQGVIAVSPSMDLPGCAEAIERRSNLLYHINFVLSLRNRMKRKARLFPEVYDASKLRGIWSIRKFDDIFTSRYSGFRDVADYYQQASSLQFAKDITVPTLLLHAKDDPFIPFAAFEHQEVRANPHIAVVATAHGGHVGFISASKDLAERFWYERQIVEFIQFVRSTVTLPGKLR
jgi:uncharacterized protein